VTGLAWQTAVDVGRWTNIGLAAVTLVILFTTVRGWKTRSAGNRFLWLGFRTAVTTVAVSFVLAAVILKRLGRWHENDRPHGGE
jgi:hypothetical protein